MVSDVVFFDNSALTHLWEEDEVTRTAMLAGLRTLGTLRVPAAAVLEASHLPDREMRVAKLRFYRQVGGAVAPFDEPNSLLRRLATEFEGGGKTFSAGDETVFNILEDPEVIEERWRDESFEWSSKQEGWFRELHQDLREELDGILQQFPGDRPRSLPDMLRYFLDRADDYIGMLLIPIYERQTGRRLSVDEMREFIDSVPAWKLFWVARLHAVYSRAMQPTGYGRRNAGWVDLNSAIYLQFCDRFITDDHKQYRALRFVNVLNPRRCKVEKYRSLRGRLMLAV